MKYVTVINKDGFIVSKCELMQNGVLKTYFLKNEEKTVERCIDGKLVKPKWNGTTWEEGATEEEIQQLKENSVTEKAQATEEQQLLSTVLLENAEIKKQLAEQQKLSATLILQIAELKGGNTDV